MMSPVPSASLYMTLLSVLLSVSADPENQHPSYQNRVDLQDRQMKDGDVSLSLKNMTIEDKGTYECRVETKTNRRKRDAVPTVIYVNVVPGQTNITAEPGQTVSLPCKALNNDPVIVVEWRRTDLKEDEYVLVYRNKRFVNDSQHPSYENRVDLQDRQMKDGDVSLSLKNVKTEDRGTYECYINQREENIIKIYVDPISIIYLDVVVPPDGHKGDEGEKDGSIGLTVGLIVGVLLLLLGVAGFLVFRIRKHRYRPPPEQSADHQQL